VGKSDNADSGPKGQENIALALAWVGQKNRLSPVRAGEIHAPIYSRYSVFQKEHYAVLGFHCPISRPCGAITVGGRATQAWIKFPRPFGPTRRLVRRCVPPQL